MTADGSSCPDPALEAAYARYRSATAAWRAAVASGCADATERTADGLLQTRVDLYRVLAASGWGAPAPVAVQLERDAALVAAPPDFAALLQA